MNKASILGLFAIFCLLNFEIKSQPVSKSNQPNFVLIFIDDMGYGDASCFGATGYTTPNIDKLAARGMRFTNFYSAQPVCSASRAALLTGCYPNRIGINGALFPDANVGINPSETTIAEMLKQKGYATAIFGKWHLGDAKEFLPLQHGFDEYCGLPYSNDMWPMDDLGKPAEKEFRRYGLPPLPLIEGNETKELITDLKGQDKLTTLYTEKAISFINRNAGRPFFLYLPHTMGHVPLGVSEKFGGKSKYGKYGDVMMEIDWSVGEIVKALEAKGIADNTVIVFTSDNGPWLNYGDHAGSAGGMREGKGTNWEGGQRVPFIVAWQGKVPAGTICNQLGCAIDILPSFAEVAGTKLSENKIDGVSLVELWKGNSEAKPRTELFYYYGRNNLNAVRKDDWKLVLPHTWDSYDTIPGNGGMGGPRVRIKTVNPELFNLMRDPGEQFDMAAFYPEKVAELMITADAARKELGDLNVGIEKGVGTRESGKLNK
jgi:arylsulfatase